LLSKNLFEVSSADQRNAQCLEDTVFGKGFETIKAAFFWSQANPEFWVELVMSEKNNFPIRVAASRTFHSVRLNAFRRVGIARQSACPQPSTLLDTSLLAELRRDEGCLRGRLVGSLVFFGSEDGCCGSVGFGEYPNPAHRC
jgi:hypothetical protein